MAGFERDVDQFSRVDFSRKRGKIETLERFMSYLSDLGIPHEGYVYKEPWEATSAEIAEGVGIPIEEMAKVLILRADDCFVMAVFPVDWQVDLEKLKEMLKVKEIRPATSREVERLFPDFDSDAVPPFGNLCQLRTCLDVSLLENESIAFQIGTRRHILRIKIADFARLSRPCVGDFRLRPHRMTIIY
jgi:prolyl-tRNA editing enzyme YbaK/EbsC (Cys-tRNA(Pro) deacylase)